MPTLHVPTGARTHAFQHHPTATTLRRQGRRGGNPHSQCRPVVVFAIVPPRYCTEPKALWHFFEDSLEDDTEVIITNQRSSTVAQFAKELLLEYKVRVVLYQWPLRGNMGMFLSCCPRHEHQ